MHPDWYTFLKQQGATLQGRLLTHFADEEPNDSCLTEPALTISHQLGLLCVSGADAADFLQGQTTVNITEMGPNDHRLGAYCNPKGRIHSVFTLFRWHNDFFLLMPSALVSHTLNTLNKYAAFSKVTVSDESDTFAMLTLLNPSAQQKTYLATQPEVRAVVHTFPQHSIDIIGPCSALQSIWQHARAHAVGTAACQLHAIRAGLPWLSADAIETFLPQELNLPQLKAVSFKKGCYTGQEIIARMQYRGTHKKHMVGLHVTEGHLPEANTPLFIENTPDKSVGQIICSAAYGKQHCALALLKKDLGEDDVLCYGADQNKARIFTLPYAVRVPS